MRIDDEAAALMAAVDPAAIAAVIAEFPEAEKVGIRANWQDIDPHLGQRVPKAPADRAEYLARKIEQYEAELQRDIATYTRYREQGLAALSAYDVCISSGNNPLGALRTALRLKHAHISYDLSILVKLSLELEDVKTELAESEPPATGPFLKRAGAPNTPPPPPPPPPPPAASPPGARAGGPPPNPEDCPP